MDWLKLLEKLMQLWKTWKLPGFVLFSFGLQCILILGSSLRIQTSRGYVHRLILLAYLLADWAAYYAIGLIIPTTWQNPGEPTYLPEDLHGFEIHAFWAPFLLLHIGGPITIAGFALQDNDLWGRSVLHLIVQASATGFIIYRSLHQNKLLGPTLLMFLAALTRYGGRIYALYKASPDAFQSYIQRKTLDRKEHNDGAASGKDAGSSEQAGIKSSARMPEGYEHVQTAISSYSFFEKNKAVFCGFSIRPANSDPLQTRNYPVLVENAHQIFRDMEIQLGFAYDLFYTKIWTIIEDRFGAFLHLVSWVSEVGALVLWTFADKHGRYWISDIRVTNTLLLGGVVVDVYSIFTLIFSDLMVPHLIKLFCYSPVVAYILEPLLLAREWRWSRFALPFRRWSGCVKQFNLMRNSSHRLYHPIWLEGICYSSCYISCGEKLKDAIRKITGYDMDVSTIKLTNDMRCCIIIGIKLRELQYSTIDSEKMTIDSEKMRIDSEKMQPSKFLSCIWEACSFEKLEGFFENLELVDFLLLWYGVTDLFYYDQGSKKSGEADKKSVEENKKSGEEYNILKLVTQQISHYLMYVLFRHPTILERAVTNMTLGDMSEHLNEFRKRFPDMRDNLLDFRKRNRDSSAGRAFIRSIGGGDGSIENLESLDDEHLFDKLMDNTLDKLKKKKGEMTRNILDLATILVEFILAFGEDGGDEIINTVWVQLLFLTAIQCSARRHMELLSQGGELITIVWLLLTNVGLTMNQ